MIDRGFVSLKAIGEEEFPSSKMTSFASDNSVLYCWLRSSPTPVYFGRSMSFSAMVACPLFEIFID